MTPIKWKTPISKKKDPGLSGQGPFCRTGRTSGPATTQFVNYILNGIAKQPRLNEGVEGVRSWPAHRGVLLMRPRLIFTVFIAAVALVVVIAAITTVRHIALQASSTNAAGKTRG